jgi:putative flippase GtrA
MLPADPGKSRLLTATRYGFVGGAGAAFSLLVYYWLVGSFSDALGYVWPSIIISVVWFPLAFFLHCRFVFGTPVKTLTAFIKFLSAQWAFFFLGPLTLVVFVELVGLRPPVAYAASMIFISVMSFFVSRLIIFRTQRTGLGSGGGPTSAGSEP